MSRVAAALRGDVGFRPFPHFYQLLHAFADEDTLRRTNAELDALGYRTHEFGDSVLIERKAWTAALGIRGRKKRPLSTPFLDRKSTRLNSSHQIISYAVFCLKKKNKARG